MSDARLIANTTRACYWRTTQGFVATKPDERPSPTCGAYVRLDELMKLKGETAATIDRVLRDEVLYASRLVEDYRELHGSVDIWKTECESLRRALSTATLKAEDSDCRHRAVALEANSLRNRVAELNESLTAVSQEVERLKERNANQEMTINTYRAQRDERGAEKRAAQELAESRRREAEQYYQDSLAQAERADKAERQLQRLMQELGGLTMSQLPGGAYGGALAEVYCDIKEGR